MGILDSKIIVITGGSMGIGFEIAKKCAIEGATVVVSARNESDIQKALKELKAGSSGAHCGYPIDVSQYDKVQQFAAWCAARFNSIHGVVNCAGIYGPVGKTYHVSMSEFTHAVQINFLGMVYMCHEFIPLIKSETRKKIVNMSGGGAATPMANYSAYSTSKTALVRFTENLSLELAQEGFDVNCVSPGFVATRIHQSTLEAGPERATPQFFEYTKRQMESGGVLPRKAADLVAFLLSRDSDGITGKFISAPWDPWQEKSFQNRLRTDKDFAVIRRIDDKTFYKKI